MTEDYQGYRTREVDPADVEMRQITGPENSGPSLEDRIAILEAQVAELLNYKRGW